MSDGGLSSVGNAARLLKAFLSREKEIGVSELARRLGLGKSTVHRLLTTLVQEGLVERNPETGAYRLGLTMFELGQVVQSHMDLHGAVGPVLAALREETHEGCQVGVLDGHEVVYIDRLESSQTLRLFNETGRRVPVHTTSSGKTLLAHLTEPELERVLAAASPLAQMTPKSVTDPAVLRAELARIRARGWSEAVEEREIGVASIAAPIRDTSGRVVAAISIGGPAARMGAQQRRRLAEVVVEAGEAASRRLGWSPETRHLREG
jgi:IclR family KDG regulon transcriptional repressor